MDVISALTDLLNAIGVASPFVIAISEALLFGIGFIRGWWVPGWVHEREVERADKARDAVVESTEATEKAATAAKTATDAALLLLQQYAADQRMLKISRPRDD